MAAPFALIRIGLRAIKRVFAGEIVHRIDTEFGGGVDTVSLRLKREKSSGNEYVVLAGSAGGEWYYVFELEEFDRFIDAANEIRTSQTSTTAISPNARSKRRRLTSIFLRGEVLRRVDTDIYAGHLKISLQLKREQNTSHEYVVLATTARGWYLYYPFELDEFHRFVAAAKKIRAASQSYDRAVDAQIPDCRDA